MTPEEYKAYGISPPQITSHHVTDEQLHKRFERAERHNWYQQGNMLKCKCIVGEHGTLIPTNKMLDGVDEEGNPILKDMI